MQLRFLSGIVVMISGPVIAMPVVISSSLEVRAEGYAGSYPSQTGPGQAYVDHKHGSVELGAGAWSAAGAATWSVPPGAAALYSPIANASSSTRAATQLDVGAGRLALSYVGSLEASIGPFPGSPVMNEFGYATQALSFVFSVDERSFYDFAFSYEGAHGHGLYPQEPRVSFTALSGAPVVDFQNIRVGGRHWNFDGSGMLDPGLYQVTADFRTSVAGDPLGDFESGSFRMKLGAHAAVSELGSTGALFGAVLMALATVVARRSRLL